MKKPFLLEVLHNQACLTDTFLKQKVMKQWLVWRSAQGRLIVMYIRKAECLSPKKDDTHQLPVKLLEPK